MRPNNQQLKKRSQLKENHKLPLTLVLPDKKELREMKADQPEVAKEVEEGAIPDTTMTVREEEATEVAEVVTEEVTEKEITLRKVNVEEDTEEAVEVVEEEN